MVRLPSDASFCAAKAAWSALILLRSLARTATAEAIALNRLRTRTSSVVTGVERCTFLRMYKRLQLGFSVAAVRCVPSSILLQLCCPFLPGFANAPDTLSIPALHSTFAIRVRQSDRKGRYHSAKSKGRPMPPLSPKIKIFGDPLYRVRGDKLFNELFVCKNEFHACRPRSCHKEYFLYFFQR